jgi:lauroyl/myristoyl acyltransferase
LTAELKFATGAPSLAWSEESALLTVSAHREGAYRYRIVIGEEIPVNRSISRKQYAEEAVTALAGRLEDLILRYPSDWQGWAYRDFP